MTFWDYCTRYTCVRKSSRCASWAEQLSLICLKHSRAVPDGAAAAKIVDFIFASTPHRNRRSNAEPFRREPAGAATRQPASYPQEVLHGAAEEHRAEFPRKRQPRARSGTGTMIGIDTITRDAPPAELVRMGDGRRGEQPWLQKRLTAEAEPSAEDFAPGVLFDLTLGCRNNSAASQAFGTSSCSGAPSRIAVAEPRQSSV